MLRRCAAALLAFAIVSCALDTVAETPAPPRPPSEERCLEAYEKGQRLRLKHALREARAELLLCARAPCPESFRPECVQWFDEVQAQVPSVIVRLDGDAPPGEVRVSIDGVLVATRLDGTPIELDPGEHALRAEVPGRDAIEQMVLVVVGEKNRVVTLRAPAASPPAPTEAPRAWTSPLLFAGIGAVALGSFAYFGATGLSQRNELDRCNPYCEQADIDDARRRFLAADVSLAISVVSLGIAAYQWLGPVRVSASPRSAFVGLVGTF